VAVPDIPIKAGIPLVRPSAGFSRAKPVSGGETGNWQMQSLNSD
jgi:hypothetical protein